MTTHRITGLTATQMRLLDSVISRQLREAESDLALGGPVSADTVDDLRQIHLRICEATKPSGEIPRPAALLISGTEHVTDAYHYYEQQRQRIAKLENLLSEAADDIEGWGSYAGEYFQQKHDMAGDVARYRTAVAPQKGEE